MRMTREPTYFDEASELTSARCYPPSERSYPPRTDFMIFHEPYGVLLRMGALPPSLPWNPSNEVVQKSTSLDIPHRKSTWMCCAATTQTPREKTIVGLQNEFAPPILFHDGLNDPLT
mmetsp:Transcript_662/g.1366  ORF Transcript_662/g.1366 Transcript_662/m.1366 type:complete len:117 (-) Transcript_662:352-702(-)